MPDPIVCQEKINQNLLLTNREKAIAGLLALGLRRKAIGLQLGIAARTADVHIMHIYKKLGLKGRDLQTTFILIAFRKGWVKVRPAGE